MNDGIQVNDAKQVNDANNPGFVYSKMNGAQSCIVEKEEGWMLAHTTFSAGIYLELGGLVQETEAFR